MKMILVNLLVLAARVGIYSLIVNWQGWNIAFLILGLDILGRFDLITKDNQ